MEYRYCTNVKEDDALRDSFNALTRNMYGFDFTEWYEKGHWGDQYIPHVLADHNRVISNVSVNIMKFNDNGQIKNYIQLGTVMTDREYRKKGLNKYLISKILKEYEGKADGIYLFANDSVLDYYPKFGFRTIREYEYSALVKQKKSSEDSLDKYTIQRVDLSDAGSCDRLYKTIELYDKGNIMCNPNESFCMCSNLGLYQFWLDAAYSENVYYLPEMKAYVIASVEQQVLNIHQIISGAAIDMEKLAGSFDEDIVQIKLGFTPAEKSIYDNRIHKIEDSTLFVLGEDLYDVEKKKYMFPVISHA